MSTEAFAPVLFPRLDGREDGEQYAIARTRGYADGHAEGFRAGRAEAESEQRAADEARAASQAAEAQRIETAVAALHAAARSLGDRERELTAAGEDQVLRCAIEIAELILVSELSEPGAAAAAALRRALTGAGPEAIREVRLNPDDLATLQTSAAEPSDIALVADDALHRGDAVATLAHGHIDARIGSALERARRALTEHAP
ncbi:hypothetical protein F6W69_15620 [Microbacterium oxydans]|uniref:FliH/SctL family protein n=1 Tax=Microbacterium oxydans TaxID=82380 RepID=UPI00114482D2|nr:FliH/SctL family protein [Microbacterium oxydans]KAB1889484.1 hypothetical protein F6W69_15620 [Microbacterium oxydans]GED39842.1 hypothetical protein MOX01_29840 [Microbacterium oxydans]